MPFLTVAQLRAGLKSSTSFRLGRLAASGIGVLLAGPFLASPSLANPAGATVTTGSAAVASSSNKTQIDQKSEDVVIDWSSFNIGAGQTTQFVQPNAQAIAVNRIGGAQASQILGTLDANGRVVLINGNGLLFGKNSQVNVGSLIATSTDGTDSDLLAGKFTNAGNQKASVINRGTITAAAGGTVALVAPNVSNTGTIRAKLGTVSLGGANTFTVDFAGDGLVSFAARGDVNGPASAINTGLLWGATVTMTARAAEGVATGVVGMRGTIEAKAAHDVGGTIVLDAGDGGDTIVAHARLDAAGANGGGTISVGGWNEASATVDRSSVLNASSGKSGNGGAVSVIANAASFEGRAIAEGGKASGNGGTIETSGNVVNAENARVDTLAAHGLSGLWTLDPENVAISTANSINGSIAGGIFTPTGDNSVLNVTTLESALSTGNVEVTTGGAGSLGSQPGNITVSAPITWSNNTLTLNAFGEIVIDKAITGSSATLDMIAGSTITQASGGIISVATLTGSSAGATLTAANHIANLGAFSSVGGRFVLTDDQSLTIDGLVNAGIHLVDIVDTGALGESGAGVIGAAALEGSSVGGVSLNGANQISDLDAFAVSGSGGFALTNTKALTIDGAVNAGSGNLTLATTGSGGNIVIDAAIIAEGMVDLISTGSISQNAASIVTAGTLTGSAAASTTLTGTNQIASLGAFTNTGGWFQLTDDQSLTIDGLVNAGARMARLTDAGTIDESGAGVIEAATLEGSSTGGAMLNGVNQINAFQTFANNGAGGFAITDNESITVNSVINAGTGALTLSTVAAGQNITIDTAQSASTFNVASAGAITLNVPLTVVGSGGLTLNAGGALSINKSITVSGAGSIALDAANDTTTVTGASYLEMTLAPGVGVSYGPANNGGSLSIEGRAYTLLYSMSDVQNINSNPNANYALAASLDASNVTNWMPIGVDANGNGLNNGAGFAGTFEGLGHTISNLVINLPNNPSAALFGVSSGTLRDVGMIGGSVTGENAAELAGSSYETVDCFATGAVKAVGTGDYGAAGGLVGSADFVIDSYATGAVSGYDNVGGLASEIYGNVVAIVNSDATGAVTGNEYIGGLVGLDSGVVSNSFAKGNVNGTGADVGGLVGESDYQIGSNLIQTAETIDSYATGAVSSSVGYAGGLIGESNSPIYVSYATGSVTSISYTPIANYVGGLAGYAFSIVNSHASGKVQGGTMAGGLAGESYRVSSSFATGAVTGENMVGGLIGETGGSISYSRAAGSVSGNSEVGGLVGNTSGATSDAYATGSVSGNNYVGGLIGNDSGAVTATYAKGGVTGSMGVGGLIGLVTNSSEISVSYSIGTVTDVLDPDTAHGFVGENDDISPNYVNDYWDTDTSGFTGGDAPGEITGLTTAQFQSGFPAGFTTATWSQNANVNGGFPFLLEVPPPS